eukprot:TRINITY_DN3420_c0_g1_i3.p1 TRINITY_DN3420_c0_g1~~TRINITY_DN3420_c0_g1_i3.p1  ORF type:complete len:378 (+),score=90.27 TRINITY_DN3420_c0_g1_i3:959-2092(+)
MLRKNWSRRVEVESEILAKVHNPSIVRLYMTFQTTTSYYMVMEYLPGGDVFSLLHEHGCLPEQVAMFYAAETVNAIAYVHSFDIVHRDIKPDNLLIDWEGHVKLVDFGLSVVGVHEQALSGPVTRRPSSTSMLPPVGSPTSALPAPDLMGRSPSPPLPMEMMAATAHRRAHVHVQYHNNSGSGHAHVTTTTTTAQQQHRHVSSRSSGGGGTSDITGTPEYLAPELLLGTGHSFAVDWWSLGVTLFEMLTGRTPFDGETTQDVFHGIMRSNIVWPEDIEISHVARDCVERLCTRDPGKRLGAYGADEIRAHPFFAEFPWSAPATAVPPFIPEVESDNDTSYFEPRQGRYPVENTMLQEVKQAVRSASHQFVLHHRQQT